jgi:hypothetical protein
MSVVVGSYPDRKARRYIYAALAGSCLPIENRAGSAEPRAPLPKREVASAEIL